jgi:type I restriction-modification system DNA methylase subunit
LGRRRQDARAHGRLGLIFLKYISDAFEEKREQLLFGFTTTLEAQFEESAKLEKAIRQNLKSLSHA